MQSRYFIMSELAAIAHDMDLLIAQLNLEQEDISKHEKAIAATPKEEPQPPRISYNQRIDAELSFIGDRFAALYAYYKEEKC